MGLGRLRSFGGLAGLVPSGVRVSRTTGKGHSCRGTRSGASEGAVGSECPPGPAPGSGGVSAGRLRALPSVKPVAQASLQGALCSPSLGRKLCLSPPPPHSPLLSQPIPQPASPHPPASPAPPGTRHPSPVGAVSRVCTWARGAGWAHGREESGARHSRPDTGTAPL